MIILCDNGKNQKRKKHTTRDILLILTVALLIRIIFFFQYSASPVSDTPTLDALYHHQWAETISAGEEFYDGTFFRAPLYPMFMALIYSTISTETYMVRFLQTLLGTFTALIVMLIGRQLFNSKTGVIAGILYALYGTVIFFEGQLLIPTFAIILNLSRIYLLLKFLDSQKYLFLFSAGIFLGLSAITRPTILLFCLIVATWFLFHYRGKEIKRHVVVLTIFLGALLIPILPVTTYNYLKSGEITMIATYGGLNFYIGNNQQSDGVSAILPEPDVISGG